MLTWIAFYVGLAAASWACLLPMLRDPRLRQDVAAPEPLTFVVPLATFDPKGMT